MRLKCIKLAGFKSFVDPTVVNFPSNMAAVVGPNGCGKSNIIDAVRWVMGESSAKYLRGESMTDVIFNGSISRKPAGHASIELVFDNSDGTLTGEYAAYSEVAIKRTVNREAESIYQLNGSRCRRRDITDIFLGTGLGPRSYAIIEQGMISKLIEAKPEELRVFVEEAAGISKYKERRRDTENRIRRTRENLERLTDIREELGRQLQHLQRQARTAERFREFKAEERTLEAQYLVIQWRDLNTQSDAEAAVIREQELALEAQLSVRASADNHIEQLRERHNEQSDAFTEVQSEFYRLGGDIARAEQQLQHQQERDRQLRQDLQQTEDNLRDANRHIAHDRENLEVWALELEGISPQLQALQANESESAAALSQAEQAMAQWQQGWDAFSERSSGPRHQAQLQQSRIQHLDQAVQRLVQRMHKLQQEQTDIALEEGEGEVEMLQEQLAEVELGLEVAEQTREQVAEDIRAQRDTDKVLTTELNRLRGDHQRSQGRHASLEALQQAALGQDEASAAWLQQQGLADSERLADGLNADTGWETAVETVLGSYVQAVNVDTIEQFSEQLAHAEAVQLALVDQAPVAAAVTVDIDGLEPLAAKVDGAHGLLAGVFCCEELTEALRVRGRLAGGQSVVTRDGLWLGANWLRVTRSSQEQGSVIARRRELEQLTGQAEVLLAEIATAELARETVASALERLEQAQRQAATSQRNDSREQSRLAAALSGLQVRIEQAGLRRQRLVQDEAEAAEQLQQEQAELAEARLLLQGALDAMAQDEAAKSALLEQRDQLRETLEQVRQQARQDQDSSHHLALSEQSLNTQMASARQAIERLSGQLQQFEERSLSLAESLEDNLAPMDEVGEELAQNLEKHVEVEQRLGEAKRALEAIDFELRQVDERRTQAEQQIETMRGTLEQQRLAFRTLEVQRTALQDQLTENRYSLAEVLEQLPAEASAGQWQQELERLRSRIQRLGAINLAAIDEYRTQAARKHYLDAQHEDLYAALATLESAIQKIDRETRNRFKETFSAINDGLQDLFPQVFGGGHAYLELTGEDLLDTGIAIMARPPGKRNSTIHLLSGGEKALTAIALVFAIFRLNPAPFCMLDEVDAPLDDANTARYARLVKQMAQHVQFIFITHSKITMEYAEQLMGVTMHEPGCSRMVTVDIEEAAELAAV
jgi:chromosome segregation protein